MFLYNPVYIKSRLFSCYVMFCSIIVYNEFVFCSTYKSIIKGALITLFYTFASV